MEIELDGEPPMINTSLLSQRPLAAYDDLSPIFRQSQLTYESNPLFVECGTEVNWLKG